MFRHSCFGLTIHSEIEIPELPALPSGRGEPDVVIRLGSVPRAPRKATMDEEIAFTEGGAFHVIQGREIVLDPLPGVDPDVLRILLTGRMMAFLLRQRGWLPLHASGVEIGGQAALFLGASGAGKSTTAAAFHSQGYAVITDDVGAVRIAAGPRCLVRPAGSRIRLLDDSRVVFGDLDPKGIFQWDKHTFNLDGGCLPGLFPVRRIYILDFGPELRHEAIPPLSAVALLSTHSFVLRRRMDREALAVHVRDCSSVAGTVGVFRLVRPRSLAALPDLVRWVEMDIAATTAA
jgi:hypothetical protein